MSDRPNIAPADEYCALKERHEADERRIAELRQLLLSDPSARTGNHYVVELKEIKKSRTDWAEIGKLYPALIKEHTYPASETHLRRHAVDPETGEIVPIRRMKTGAHQQ